MRTLVVSDLHGDLAAVLEAIEVFHPDALLCCGDWGDASEVEPALFLEIVARLPVATTFGNHDPMPLLEQTRNHDHTPVLLGQGEVRAFRGLTIAAIGGIWAKSHRLPHYVTDGDVAALAARIAADSGGGLDILLTHACSIGLADRTPTGRHGGQRCFLEAFQTIRPRIHLCGHLHVPQESTLKDGRRVLNVGATPAGSVVLIETTPDGPFARQERFERSPSSASEPRPPLEDAEND